MHASDDPPFGTPPLPWRVFRQDSEPLDLDGELPPDEDPLLLPEDDPLFDDDLPFDEDDSSIESGPRLHDTAPVTERALLVGVSLPPSRRRFETDEHLEELEALVETAGAEVVEKVYQNLPKPVSATFIGSGKVEYIAERCKDADIHSVIFDDDLTPIQQRNLETAFQRKVIDRTTLILDIFAKHAHSTTSRTQVELAQLEYLLPRLSGMWTHLSKQYGGIRTKGPGETQIESDRRMLRERIAHLRKKLERIDRQRETQRKGRRDVVRVALVGYTNVGKSTLLNTLTGANVLAEDKLFATLDATVRSIEYQRHTVLLSDTVGFIRKLPTKLVASFKSTLDEVVEADLILHVADLSHHGVRDQIDIVNETLKDIGADGKPTIMVFNKIDAIEEMGMIASLRERYPQSVFISAARAINLGELHAALGAWLEQRVELRRFIISPADYKALAEIHEHGRVRSEEYTDTAILVDAELPPAQASRLLKSYPALRDAADPPNPGDD